MRVQMHSSAYRDRNRKLKPGSAWPLRRQLPDLRCAKPTAYGARDRNRTGMPGLAAAGFKPAVYTNFTTLANRRMILEERIFLIAAKNLPNWSNMLDCSRHDGISTSNNVAISKKMKFSFLRTQAKVDILDIHARHVLARPEKNGFSRPVQDQALGVRNS